MVAPGGRRCSPPGHPLDPLRVNSLDSSRYRGVPPRLLPDRGCYARAAASSSHVGVCAGGVLPGRGIRGWANGLP